MPELPEVETTRRGIEPHIVGARIEQLVIRQRQLRWPVAGKLDACLRNSRITGVGRRAKYLLITTEAGTLIIHLGMSGSLRIIGDDTAPGLHDHIDLLLENGSRLRFRDPRRFGAWLWTDQAPEAHPQLKELGAEPLSSACNTVYIHRLSRGR